MENVPACPNCTRLDESRGERFRVKDCEPVCEIMERARQTGGLTRFLVKLMTYKNEDVLKADPKKAAKLYGISKDHAAGYIALEKQTRGLVNG